MTWVMAAPGFARDTFRVTDTTMQDQTGTPAACRDQVLGLRVSEVIDRYPGALEVLIDAGFGPLAVPALRAALAPTVTLRQALRIRGRSEASDAELLEALMRQASCPS